MAGDIEEQTPPKNFKPATPAQAPNPSAQPIQPVAPAPVAQPAPAPQAAPVQPAATPTPVAQPIPAKPLIPKPAPIKPPVKTVKTTTPAAPKKPGAPKGSTPAQPAANGEQPKKSILGAWWFLSLMTIIIIGLITGIFFLVSGNPFSPDNSGTPPIDDQQGGNQSQIPDPIINDSGIDLEIFTCEEIVRTNKEILNISCEEGAIISVVEGMDYITTIYADSTDDACVNGPTELLEYARSTCGDETFTTINSLAFVPIDEPELVP